MADIKAADGVVRQSTAPIDYKNANDDEKIDVHTDVNDVEDVTVKDE